MYVKRLFYDNWKDLTDIEKCIELPTWEEVEMVINMLDGKNVTQVTMDNGIEDDYLCIGGGNNELYNVFISSNDNQMTNTLIKTHFNSTLVHKLVTGGQEGDFDDKICVSLKVVKCVAKKYYELGQADSSFEWEQLMSLK